MEAPNVILRYSFSADCTSFDKLVRVLPGASVGSDGNDITPHICKITAVKQTPAVSSCPSEDDFDEEAPCDYDGKCEFGEESCCGKTFASKVCQCAGDRSFCYFFFFFFFFFKKKKKKKKKK